MGPCTHKGDLDGVQAPGSGLAQPWLLGAFGGENQGMEDGFLSLPPSPSLSHSSFQINRSYFKKRKRDPKLAHSISPRDVFAMLRGCSKGFHQEVAPAAPSPCPAPRPVELCELPLRVNCPVSDILVTATHYSAETAESHALWRSPAPGFCGAPTREDKQHKGIVHSTKKAHSPPCLTLRGSVLTRKDPERTFQKDGEVLRFDLGAAASIHLFFFFF